MNQSENDKESKRHGVLMIPKELQIIRLVLIGVGIPLAVVGALVSTVYYSYLQSCIVNRVPCPNYSIWIDNGFLILGSGLVILVLGALISRLSGENKVYR
jgi:hypothetical protein